VTVVPGLLCNKTVQVPAPYENEKVLVAGAARVNLPQVNRDLAAPKAFEPIGQVPNLGKQVL
jgi:hypothetical protein